MRIGITEICVDDQDKARTFNTDVLGLVVKFDASYRGTYRWLAVVSPEEPDGTQLLRAPTNDAAAALQAARRQSGDTGLVVHHRQLSARLPTACLERRRVLSAPQPIGYGGIDAVFEDGCGNLLNLHREDVGRQARPLTVGRATREETDGVRIAQPAHHETR